jgi:hypothetical protein
MLTVTQQFVFLVGCFRATAAVSTDGGGVPALIRDFFGSGPVYEQTRFNPLSFNAAEKLDHHNGSIERSTGPCYGIFIPADLCSIYLSLSLLILLKLKTQVTPVTAHYAVTMAAVLAPARSVVETESVMRVMDAVMV